MGNCSSSEQRDDLFLKQQFDILFKEKENVEKEEKRLREMLQTSHERHELEIRLLSEKVKFEKEQLIEELEDAFDIEWEEQMRLIERDHALALSRGLREKEIEMEAAIRAARLGAARVVRVSSGVSPVDICRVLTSVLAACKNEQSSVVTTGVTTTTTGTTTWIIRGDVVTAALRDETPHRYFLSLDPPVDPRHGILRELRTFEKMHARDAKFARNSGVELYRPRGKDRDGGDIVYYRLVPTVKRMRRQMSGVGNLKGAAVHGSGLAL